MQASDPLDKFTEGDILRKTAPMDIFFLQPDICGQYELFPFIFSIR